MSSDLITRTWPIPTSASVMFTTTEMVHGRARAPPRQTWRVAVDEGRLRVLVLGVLAIVMVAANCERKQLKAVPGIVRLQHTARTYPSIQA